MERETPKTYFRCPNERKLCLSSISKSESPIVKCKAFYYLCLSFISKSQVQSLNARHSTIVPFFDFKVTELKLLNARHSTIVFSSQIWAIRCDIWATIRSFILGCGIENGMWSSSLWRFDYETMDVSSTIMDGHGCFMAWMVVEHVATTSMERKKSTLLKALTIMENNSPPTSRSLSTICSPIEILPQSSSTIL